MTIGVAMMTAVPPATTVATALRWTTTAAAHQPTTTMVPTVRLVVEVCEYFAWSLAWTAKEMK